MESLGAVAASIQILANLGKAVMTVQAMIRDIGDIDKSTAGFEQELEAFQFSLIVFATELKTKPGAEQMVEWWDSDTLGKFLANASKTLGQLETIFRDISRRRSVLPKIGEYYRTKKYGSDVERLRRNINTYMVTLNLPVVLLARYLF
jgi:hypothetical protein